MLQKPAAPQGERGGRTRHPAAPQGKGRRTRSHSGTPPPRRAKGAGAPGIPAPAPQGERRARTRSHSGTPPPRRAKARQHTVSPGGCAAAQGRTHPQRRPPYGAPDGPCAHTRSAPSFSLGRQIHRRLPRRAKARQHTVSPGGCAAAQGRTHPQRRPPYGAPDGPCAHTRSAPSFSLGRQIHRRLPRRAKARQHTASPGGCAAAQGRTRPQRRPPYGAPDGPCAHTRSAPSFSSAAPDTSAIAAQGKGAPAHGIPAPAPQGERRARTRSHSGTPPPRRAKACAHGIPRWLQGGSGAHTPAAPPPIRGP